MRFVNVRCGCHPGYSRRYLLLLFLLGSSSVTFQRRFLREKTRNGGRGGIRTHGGLPHARFRVECLKPDSATLPLRRKKTQNPPALEASAWQASNVQHSTRLRKRYSAAGAECNRCSEHSTVTQGCLRGQSLSIELTGVEEWLRPRILRQTPGGLADRIVCVTAQKMLQF